MTKEICENCSHWQNKELDGILYDEYNDTAPCKKLLEVLDIEAGYIGADRVNTKSYFGCVHFKRKSEGK